MSMTGGFKGKKLLLAQNKASQRRGSQTDMDNCKPFKLPAACVGVSQSLDYQQPTTTTTMNRTHQNVKFL